MRFRILAGTVFASLFAGTACLSAPAADSFGPGAVPRLDAANNELQPYRVKVNGKEYDFVGLLGLRPSDTDKTEVQTTVPFRFTHPGTLNDLEELADIKKKIAAGKEPWATAFLKLKNSSYAKPDYLAKMPEPPAIISSGFSGANAHGAFEEMRDATAAHAQALMWIFTGDRTYAKNAEAILETYARTVTSHEGPNWYLLVAWAGSVFPVAADLLHATDPEWKNDRLVAKWFNDVFLPPLHNRIAFGNREFAVINAMAAIGVFNEDPAAFYEALNHWVNYVPAYYYLEEDGPVPRLPDYWTPEITPDDEFLKALNTPTFPKDWQSWIDLSRENFSVAKRRGKMGDDSTYMTRAVREKDPGIVWSGSPGTYISGYTAENGRDLAHVEVAFVSTINLAEISWHQGIDLYSPAAQRLTVFMESLTDLRLGTPPPASLTTPLKPLGTGPGAMEITYDRYHNLLRYELPHTLKFLESVTRPAGGQRVYPVAKGEAGLDPENPRLWKYPAPFPSLFATSIGEEAGWLSSWQSLTHRDLHKP